MHQLKNIYLEITYLISVAIENITKPYFIFLSLLLL